MTSIPSTLTEESTIHPTQTVGFLAFNPGDDITFVRWDSLETYSPNKITDAKLLNPTELLLALEKPVPPDLKNNDAKGWFESGCIRDMTIRGKTFVNCAEPVIDINRQNSAANDSVHQNIRIEDNDFVLRGTTMIRGKSTKYLNITGNTTYPQRQFSDESAIQISDCSDVKVEKNRYLRLSKWVNKP